MTTSATTATKEKRKRQKRNTSPRYLTAKEAQMIIEAAENKRDELLLRLMWQSGARASEACKIRKRDIGTDPITELPKVTLTNLKQRGFAEKVCAVSLDLYTDLMEFCDKLELKQDDFVFRSKRSLTGGPIGRKMVYRIVTKLTTKLGIRRPHTDGISKPAWPHTFRHGCAVNILSKTHDIRMAQGQLGHTRLSSTEPYLQITASDRLTGLQKVFE